MSHNALRASSQPSAFSFQLLSGMKSSRRAKNMEDSNTVRWRASCQRSAFSIQLLNSATNRHVRAKPIRGMKSSRRAKNMEDSNTKKLVCRDVGHALACPRQENLALNFGLSADEVPRLQSAPANPYRTARVSKRSYYFFRSSTDEICAL